MATSENPQKPEHPSTYVVQDRQNQQELTRLTVQDQLVTSSMGGVWPEQPDPERFQRVLDVACGPGNWGIEVALKYPGISVVGADVSERMIGYAREQALQAGVQERVKFETMDALRMLEFPAASFDLVNMRFGLGFLRTWDWPKLLSEFRRVCRADGVIRLTESEVVSQSPSQALMQINEMLQCSLFRAGHLFENETTGVSAYLASLLKRHVSPTVHTQNWTFTFRAGTSQAAAYYENIQHFTQTVRPFYQKWGCLAENYDALVEQALNDMQQPDFYLVWKLITAWTSIPE